jgi:uncharacterized protein with HEPN domain
MPRDFKLYLEDIIESIEKIQEYSAAMSFDQFCADRKTQDAVVRNLEVIGGTARNLPEEIKDRIADIEWKKITSLRNLLAHEYFGINQKIIWDIIQNKIPQLYQACKQHMI